MIRRSPKVRQGINTITFTKNFINSLEIDRNYAACAIACIVDKNKLTMGIKCVHKVVWQLTPKYDSYTLHINKRGAYINNEPIGYIGDILANAVRNDRMCLAARYNLMGAFMSRSSDYIEYMRQGTTPARFVWEHQAINSSLVKASKHSKGILNKMNRQHKANVNSCHAEIEKYGK